ncbi:hypothetical protein PLESTB_000172900 [Pleodorina starrii]|uniref:Uncharacterized protein n=1 Tax=Pleodorina starrii TaxID=330485 RepID=A0A9W6BC99_9CHLO|nr:hypothetical protein PLESTM_000523900 [Pleodorina starrii]GLC49012.1 hypothetical protein PLESTB_000172900 [Pleodorina starrii]GLC66193.1 hypothetical protein PLESTF_000395000 [Pleodorina starrii]
MADPALPWAHPAAEADVAQAEPEQEPATTQDDKSKFLTLDTAGIAIGGRIEVKWQVEPDEGEAYYRWWGASIVGPSDQQDAERPAAPVYELLYDAHDDFEQERGHVVLITEHTLRQLDQTEELTWRREGDTWDDDGDEDGGSDDAEEEEANGERLLTMDDLKQLGEQGLEGRSLEEVEQEALQSLEPNKRIAVAAGFRDFADNLMSFLHERVSAEGNGVVTADHVKSFTEAMLKKQRTR